MDYSSLFTQRATGRSMKQQRAHQYRTPPGSGAGNALPLFPGCNLRRRKNSRHEDVYSPISPEFYIPISQEYTSAQTLQIRTSGPPETIAPEILSLARHLAPTAPVLS